MGGTASGGVGPGAGGVGTGGLGPSTGGGVGSGGIGPGSGGGPGTGGVGSGGAPGSGGGPVSAEWGLVENPSAACTVGALPARDALTANPKLPDPFEKMDGTRITDRSEWVCRREEARRQAHEFIYGEKPIPEDGAVSGSVTNNSISVEFDGPEGPGNFMMTLSMNGATAPAPAIITYGATQVPIPSGVARISFTPTEPEGGSGPKSGPFYNAYGSDHPAGYLIAHAWMVSRVLDVLEQNPGTIDPYRVGVTGCSRYGKGAFVAGATDNRIALTIPVESGLGGTVGLRLVQVLDPGNMNSDKTEWPYHGISYVRWMSEVALGAFTTANFNAAADETEELPVDMHDMMAQIAPRGLYIVDNPDATYPGLDKRTAYVTGKVGQMIFEALGVGDHFTYQGASGPHCTWRSDYTDPLNAMIDKFLRGNDAAATGTFDTDLSNPPNHLDHIDWEPPTLTGEL